MSLTSPLGVDVPVVLGPFCGRSPVELTAAASEAGCQGSYGLYEFDGERFCATAVELGQDTGQPFALNLGPLSPWLGQSAGLSPFDNAADLFTAGVPKASVPDGR